jgi:hypothetical protein
MLDSAESSKDLLKRATALPGRLFENVWRRRH